jgi:lysine decarboxylase
MVEATLLSGGSPPSRSSATPAGIPTLLPGEQITAEVVEYLRALTAAGARLHGAADPSFTTVRVLVDVRGR